MENFRCLLDLNGSVKGLYIWYETFSKGCNNVLQHVYENMTMTVKDETVPL